MKRTLLFDFDGTLADSFGVVQEVFYELTNHPRIEDPEAIQQFRRLPILKVARELGVTPWQMPRLLVQGRKAMNRHMHEVKPFPGIVDALRTLHESGHVMYILSSNSAQNVDQFLKANGLNRCFERVYGGVGLVGKTSAIRKVLRHNKLIAKDCLYIGDETRDIEGAKRAGIQVISVAWGYNDAELLQQSVPDALAQTPQEMTHIIQAL